MKKGDHIVTPRFGYKHHGLYIGNKQVIHYAGSSEGFDKGWVEITSLKAFKQGNGCEVKDHAFANYDAKERVERAHAKLGEDEYHILFNNCEHFVHWCFDGVKSSPQVNKAVASTAILAGRFLNGKGFEAAAGGAACEITRVSVAKTVETTVARSLASTTAGSIAALGTASTIGTSSIVTGTATTAGVASIVAGGTVTSLATSVAVPVVVAVGVGYGIKKAFDWLME